MCEPGKHPRTKKMIRFFAFPLVVAVCTISATATFGYEINNHADMSQEALLLSKLNDVSPNSKLARLGLRVLPVRDKRQLFPLVPVAGTLPEIRYCFGEYLPGGIAREYEKTANAPLRFQDSGIEQPDWSGGKFTIAQLFRYGACFEDSEQPFARPLSHFYDVQNGGVGAPVPLPGGSPNSLRWSLRRGESSSATGINHYTWQDARNAFYYALTGRNLDEQNPVTDVRREAAWARTFQALGHVMHHLQDMASPQHVRGDYHCNDNDKCNTGLTALLGVYRPSGYEYYFDQRFQVIRNLAATATAPTMFGLPREFWNMNTDNALGTSNPSRVMNPNEGIAAFTSTNFTSMGKNFYATIVPPSTAIEFRPAPGLPYPIPANAPTDVPIADLFPANTNLERVRAELCGGDLAKCKMQFIGTSVDSTARTASLSAFAQSAILNPANTFVAKGYFSQNFFTYTDAAIKLVPKAVEYSAGLIDYFFRGELKLEPTSDGVFGVLDHASDTGFRKIVVKVTNTTPAITYAATGAAIPQDMNGSFVAVIRYHRDQVFQNNLTAAIGLGSCATLAAIYGAGNEPYDATGNANAAHDPARSSACRDGVERIVVSAPLNNTLASNEEKEMIFDFSANPVPVAGVDYTLQVVFKGTLGAEPDAVAIGVRTMTDPMFYTRHNIYDLIMSDFSQRLGFYSGYFGQEPDQRPTPPGYFVSANTRALDFPPYPDLLGHGYQCWSFFGITTFKCYDYTLAHGYTYTTGPRTQSAIASAAGVLPGRFTRLAIVAPLANELGQPIDPPLMRIERQRSQPGPYTGETVAAKPRHARGRVAWPGAIRDVNSWHSDGYVWRIYADPAYSRVEYRYSVRDNYCYVFPRTQLSGSNTKSMEESNPSILDLAGDSVQLNTNATFRLSSSRTPGTPSYYTPVTYSCSVPTYADIAAQAEFGIGIPIQGESQLFVSTYSPWELYLGTTAYSERETPAGQAAFYPVDFHSPYLQLPKMRTNGITASPIAAQPPLPVTVASKYR
jgi:hypothetical protein